MKVLLDTCAFIWAISDPDRLTVRAVEALKAKDTAVFFSPITCAEVACLCEKGRLSLDQHWKTWFDRYVELNGWKSVDITVPIVQDAYALPESFHADPADRIIVATARVHQTHLITGDRKLIDYPFVETLWA